MTFPEVMQVLLGRVPVIEEAALAGWRVVAIPDREYPALVKAEAIAHGGLISDLSAAEWRLIDVFVGEAYELRVLGLADGRDAWVYVGARHHDASGPDWDATQFEKDRLVEYLTKCADWRRAYQAQLSSS